MESVPFQITASGDTALVIEFGDLIDRTLSDRVLNANTVISHASLNGIVELVPTFRSLMVHYDPLTITASDLIAELTPLIDVDCDSGGGARHWKIPTCYEGDKAPDLENVAQRTGLTQDVVVNTHINQLYHVYMIGFLPGYPYMGDLPEALQLPRREAPRLRVPAGSIAIATTMTAIYPIESPGGWHLIGTTPVSIFDSRFDNPAVFSPGDAVTFVPVSTHEFHKIELAVAAGDYALLSAEHKS